MNRTPLRYPGGKQKVTPFVEQVLKANGIDGHYIEPYAGGAGVALSLLISRKVKNIHLNDSDIRIYAFWHSVVNHSSKLCKRIASASLTIEEWQKRKEILQNPKKYNLFELGYSTFYLNRCNRSGVLNAGVIGGKNQDGNYKMDARFSRNDLIRRIELISLFKNQIHISNKDAEFYIENYIPNLPQNSLIYLDPPYYNKGQELYLNAYKPEDHRRLSETIQKIKKCNWILSYDGVPEIVKLYTQRRNFKYKLQYSAAQNYKGTEIFIFGDSIIIPRECGLKYIDKELDKMKTGHNMR